MANTLESVILRLMRAGHVVNLSQLTALVQSEGRDVGTQAVRLVVFRLERAGVLRRESADGLTRFRWNAEAGAVTADTISRQQLDELARLAMEQCDWVTVKSCNVALFGVGANRRKAARARCAIAWNIYHGTIYHGTK